MIPKITVKQMLAARMLVEDHTDKDIYEKCEVSQHTLRRWLEDPEFQAYQEVVRQEHNSFLMAATQIERKKYKITLAGLVEELAKMAYAEVDLTKLSAFDKRAAITSLIDILRLKPAEGAPEAAGEKPDVYRPEWMN
jgi:Helix-turn-helix of insertion element transposase